MMSINLLMPDTGCHLGLAIYIARYYDYFSWLVVYTCHPVLVSGIVIEMVAGQNSQPFLFLNENKICNNMLKKTRKIILKFLIE